MRMADCRGPSPTTDADINFRDSAAPRTKEKTMSNPEDLLYSASHEWAKVNGEEAVLGITLWRQRVWRCCCQRSKQIPRYTVCLGRQQSERL